MNIPINNPYTIDAHELQGLVRSGLFHSDLNLMQRIYSKIKIGEENLADQVHVNIGVIYRDNTSDNLVLVGDLDELYSSIVFWSDVNTYPDSPNVLHNLIADLQKGLNNMLTYNNIHLEPRDLLTKTNLKPTGVIYTGSNVLTLVYTIFLHREVFSKITSKPKYSLEVLRKNINTQYDIGLHLTSKEILNNLKLIEITK